MHCVPVLLTSVLITAIVHQSQEDIGTEMEIIARPWLSWVLSNNIEYSIRGAQKKP